MPGRTNDPQLFRRRRAERLVAGLVREAGPGGDPDAVAREALARVEADPALREAMVLSGLEALVEEELKAMGHVEAEPGVWRPPGPGDAA